jgi:hypothetical protein
MVQHLLEKWSIQPVIPWITQPFWSITPGVKTGYSTYCPGCYADCGKRALTNETGEFTIENLSPDLWFTLLVLRDGYFPEFVKQVDPFKGSAPEAVLKTRQPVGDADRVVRGKIVDFQGRSIQDAIVHPEGIVSNDEKRGRITTYGSVSELDPIAVTNEAGEFEVAYKRPALEALLIVEARGYAPKLFNHLQTGLERHVLTIGDGATLRGRLVDNGDPVANAQMGLIPRQRGMGAELKMFGAPYDEMRIGTQEDGTFIFTNVPIPVEFYVYGKMESISERGATEPMESATKIDGEDVNVGDIEINPGFRLRGKVALSDGKSIPDSMRVTISADRAWDSQTVFLQPDGSFEFSGLASEKYQVFASVKGYRAPEWDYTMKTHRPGTVQVEQDIDDFVLVLEPVK